MAQRPDIRISGDVPNLSWTQTHANEYIKSKKLFELFNFLIGHILIEEPEDPVEFLVNLMDKCILFREGRCEPPLLFNAQHLESMFRALDPARTGSITDNQFKTGMTTLGITNFRQDFPRNEDGKVDQHTFLLEAKTCLVTMLEEILKKQ